MAKTLAISHHAWHKLKEKIIEDYGQTTVMISWRLRDQVGFTVREHHDYNQNEWHLSHNIRLDFWDDQMQTMFLLRYSDFLNYEAS